MPRILYIQPIHPDGMAYLAGKPGYEVAVAPDTQRETLAREIADADAVVTRLTAVDAELMRHARHLRAVCKHGVGVDNIDTGYCRAHGIAVLTTGDANSSTVAEQAMLAIGALLRRMPWLDQRMREGDWQSRDRAGAADLMGRTLGLVGYGRIGKCLARMAARGFLMEVCVYDPYADRAEVEAEGFRYAGQLEDVLRAADALSLHVPLTDATRGMIGAQELALMKPGALVVNFARGGVVDEAALTDALRSGHLGGAALDVFETEPPAADNPLLHMDNVILSPHCATFTEDSRRRMSMRLALELERTLDK
ncbi:MAG: hydroxyacid dehydrogenase [Aristaeellaceae bacterium]